MAVIRFKMPVDRFGEITTVPRVDRFGEITTVPRVDRFGEITTDPRCAGYLTSEDELAGLVARACPTIPSVMFLQPVACIFTARVH
jgi:hypothetical protein